MNIIKNKKGWIKIVEAFFAILLVAGVVMIVVGGENPRRGDLFERVYDTQISILREIQLESSLRTEILGTSGTVEWDDLDFPSETKAKIEERTPSFLECVAKICNPGSPCQLEELKEANVFSESVIISANQGRLLKLFCWD